MKSIFAHISLILVLFLGYVSPVQADIPYPEPDWFVPNLDIDISTAPKGVTVEVLQRYTSRDEIFITNPSDQPLYLLSDSPPQAGITQNLPGPIPPGMIAISRIVSGIESYWDPMMNAWIEREGANESSNDFYAFDTRWVVVLTGDITDLNQYVGRRPADVVIPPQQQTHLTFLYGSELWVLPVTLSYDLNPAYDAEYQEYLNNIEEEARGYRSLYIFAAIIIVGCVGLTIFGVVVGVGAIKLIWRVVQKQLRKT